MITFFKKLFGLDKPTAAEAKTEAPYKVETPLTVGSEGVAPTIRSKAVAVENAEILPVSFPDIPVMVAPTKAPEKSKATVKKQQSEKKPAAVKAPTKTRKPAAK